MTSFVKTLVIILALGASVVGCKGKSSSNDQSMDSSSMPGVDSSPLSYDLSGSDSGKIQGLSSIRFGYDQSVLDAEAKAILAANAEWMNQNADYRIQIEGHCDARGTIEYNVALGERRAKAVKKYIVGLGVSEARLSVISYGKEKPLVEGDMDSVYAQNRRANFVPIK